MIYLSNQIASYNKVDIGYQPNNNAKSLISICHAKKKINPLVYKRNYCDKDGHLEYCCSGKLYDLIWSKLYISKDPRHLKTTNAKDPNKFGHLRQKSILFLHERFATSINHCHIKRSFTKNITKAFSNKKGIFG